MEKCSVFSRVYRFLNRQNYEDGEADKEKGMEIKKLGETCTSSESCEADSVADEEGAAAKLQNVSVWKTTFNIMNFMTGVGFLAIPYALKLGGLSALIGITLMPVVHWYTGKILLDCLYREDRLYGNRIRVSSTYRDVGEACLPRVGGILVDVAVYSGIFLAPVSYLVLCGSLLSFILPTVPLTQTTWMLVTAAVVLPTTFFEQLGQIAWMSFISMAAIFGTIVITISYGATRIYELPDWQSSELLFWNTETAAVALGIIFFCYETHVVLTDMEEGMAERHKFGKALAGAYALVAISKITLAVFGFMAFGQNTKEIIIHNLPSGPIRTSVSSLFIVSMMLTCAVPLHAMVHNLEHNTVVENVIAKLPKMVWFAGIRIVLFVLTLITAMLFPHFAALSAFAGSLTVPVTSMIFPALFHLRLKHRELNVCEIITDVVLVFFGFFLGSITLYFSGKVLFVG